MCIVHTVFFCKAKEAIEVIEASDVIISVEVIEAKAMKSSPLLGPFCGSEFWGFSLLKI